MSSKAPDLTVAKSNYLLREIRRLFEPSFEYFVDWSFIRACNGAIVTDGRSTWQILFYPRNGKHAQPSGLITDLEDMTVATYIKQPRVFSIAQKEYEDLIRHAERAFARAADTKSSEILQQIGRLHFRMMCASDVADGKNKCDEFIRRLTTEIQGTLLFEPEHEDDWTAADVEPALLSASAAQIPYEAEVEFVPPRPEELVRSQLRSILPELACPLGGFGQRVTAERAGVLREAGLSMLQVYSRHF
jgi:hypothetical protein